MEDSISDIIRHFNDTVINDACSVIAENIQQNHFKMVIHLIISEQCWSSICNCSCSKVRATKKGLFGATCRWCLLPSGVASIRLVTNASNVKCITPQACERDQNWCLAAFRQPDSKDYEDTVVMRCGTTPIIPRKVVNLSFYVPKTLTWHVWWKYS